MDEAERFEQTLSSRMASYGLELSSKTLTQLVEYYRLLTRWTDRLHLVAPCTPEEFATRHVLESLLLLRHLPQHATVADVGLSWQVLRFVEPRTFWMQPNCLGADLALLLLAV